MQDEIRDTEAHLAVLRAKERDEQEEVRKAVQPRYLFTLMPVIEKSSWERIYDPMCKLYKLSGSVLNGHELKAVGKVPFEGSMNYLWNGATYSFVTAVGGGSSFIKEQETFDMLSAFVLKHPEGGDVTELVEQERLAKES